MTEATTAEGESTWAKLRRRKVVQWGIAYVAGAWGFLQGLEYVSGLLNWPDQLQKLAGLALLIGLPIVLVLAWYHGDKGQQRVTRTELAILTLLFLLGGGLFWRYEHTSQPASTTAATAAARSPTMMASDAGPSIAVLPFENRSAKQDDAFFVDGIHDDILTQLSKISALKVISRTSVEQFRDTKLPTKAIADQLGVNSILEGGVQRAGDRVRINVQLIDANTDAHLWAETYDRELTAENIFAIQTELAAAITGALKATLTPAEEARVRAIPTHNLQAWEAYQLGQQRLAKRTGAALIEAEGFFRRAIELDPKFALAYAGLADSLGLRTVYTNVPLGLTLDTAQQAVETALKLDPGLSDAWAAAGLIAGQREQYAEEEKLLRRALELDPNNSMALMWLGQVLGATSRMEEAVSTTRKAAELDPLSAIIQVNLGSALEANGEFRAAANHYRRAIEIDPLMPGPYAILGGLMAYASNRFADAMPLAQKAVELDPGSPNWSYGVALLYFDLGDRHAFFAEVEQAERRWPDETDVQFFLALSDLVRRDDSGAVGHAERALVLEPRNGNAMLILRNADLQNGRYDEALARYQKAYPELFVTGAPRLDRVTYSAAIDLALVLQKRGDTARAKVLLDSAERVISKLPRLGAYGYGIADVQIHALRGGKARALAALRDAGRAGWRGPGWSFFLDYDPSLASIRNDPEFKAVFADIERDMARQRAELAARPKDSPLVPAPVQ